MYHNSLYRTRGGSFDGGKSSVVSTGAPPPFPQSTGSVRETGIIDKLMTSFGFITCCERNESIFFHFSQCTGNEDPTELKPGDEVEFEVGTDARTGKLIARRVVRLPPGTVSFESVGEERLLGKVECEPLITRSMDAPKQGGTKASTDPGMGRIIYERNGEFFFIPYAFTDVNDDREIHRGDEVSFYMARNKRTTALRARLVRLVQSAKVEKIQGIVKTLKDSFGFIERADEAKDIFFHKSELAPGCEEEICVGAYVEFVVQDRQGKDVATQLKVLPPGSVQFDDIGSDTLEGVVKKPLIRSFTHGHAKENEPIPGEIIYISDGNKAQTLPYTEQDQLGTYTMLSGDTVTFNLTIRRRNGAQRATNVRVLKLIEKNMNRNLREMGMVATLRDGFGFIRCATRADRLFFHFNEVIDIEHSLSQHDEVEFSVSKDHTQERLHATRITICDPGTVQFEEVSDEMYVGRVELELQTECSRNPPQPFKIQDTADHGIIRFHVGDGAGEEEINFYWSPEPLRFGDQVEFQVACRCYDGLCYATSIKVVQWAKDFRFQGFIVTLKDSYGFIEPEEHDCEMFFPFSSCNKFCDPQELEIMDEVEYCIVKKSGKMSADEIKKLPQGTIPKEEVQPGNYYEGVVIKAMKSTDNTLDYEGIIKCTNLEEGVTSNGLAVPQELPYSFTSIEDHRATLQLGDTVDFQVGISPHSRTLRAVNVRPKFAFIRGNVDSIKDQYGFIVYAKDGQTENVFFHMNSLVNGCAFTDLKPGDEVEFLTAFNQKTQRTSAAQVKKLSASVRPDRLVRKNPQGSNSTANMCVLRQPKGPDEVGCGFAPRSSSAGHP